MKKNFTLLCLSFMCLFSANVALQAQSTTLTLDLATAGSLETMLGGNKTTVENLTLSGKINGDDVNVIRAIATDEALTQLDLTDVTIVGGTTYTDKFGATQTTIDNELSTNMFHILPNLTSLVLPKNITKIGDGALFYTQGLKSLVIPNGVTHLGTSALGNNPGLEKLTLSKSLSFIGQGTFSGNKGLTEIYALNPEPASTADAYVFSGIDMAKCTLFVPIGSLTKYTGRVVWMKFTNVEESAPEKPTELAKTVNVATAGSLGTLLTQDEKENVTDLTITGDINGTDVKVIREMENLFTIDITGARIVAGGDIFYSDVLVGDCRTSNDEVAPSMFRDLIKLKSVLLPASVTKIGNHSFYGCTALEAINIPNAVTVIGKYAFTQCASIATYTFGENIASIGEYAFANNKSMPYFDVPNSVTTLGNNVFSGNTALVRVTTGANVSVIPTSMLTGCTSLIDLRLGKNITLIEDNAFNGCTALSAVKLPESVTEIGSAAFRSCTGLKSMTIGKNVTKIVNGAFLDCTGLTEIHSNSVAPAVLGHANVFGNVPFATCTLYVPTGSKAAYEAKETWKEFFSIKEEIISGITSDEAVNVSVVGVTNGIEISVEEPTAVSIYTVLGAQVFAGQVNGSDVVTLSAGVYVVKAGTRTVKVMVK